MHSRALNCIDLVCTDSVYLEMQFEWDPDKRQAKIEKHGIDFIIVRELFTRPLVFERSNRGNETRWKVTGSLKGRFITVIFTLRKDRIRIISARRARENEQKTYEEIFSR